MLYAVVLLVLLVPLGGCLVAGVCLGKPLAFPLGAGFGIAVPFGVDLGGLPGGFPDAGLGCGVLVGRPSEGLCVSLRLGGVLGEHLVEDLGASLGALVVFLGVLGRLL